MYVANTPFYPHLNIFSRTSIYGSVECIDFYLSFKIRNVHSNKPFEDLIAAYKHPDEWNICFGVDTITWERKFVLKRDSSDREYKMNE